jgi:HD-GYP domain-containing protein (c-di-GMP phosphodiesterase class II)
MRRVRVSDTVPGMILAKEIYDWSGQLVMDTGKALDEPRIMRLNQSDTTHVLIQDMATADIIIISLVPDELEAETATLLHRLMEKNRGRAVADMALETATVDRLIKAILQNMKGASRGSLTPHNSVTPDNCEYVHGVRSAILSMYIGQRAGYTHPDLVKLGKAALLKDIGYAYLPKELTAKPEGALTAEESHNKRHHPALGYKILSSPGNIEPEINRAVAEHHERWDGSGYPRRLSGHDISEFARIITIADTYNRLGTTVTGPSTMSQPEAAQHIRQGSGTLFDPYFTEIFLTTASFCPTGTMVRLNNGDYGVVVTDNPSYICRPVIRICYDQQGTKFKKTVTVNLAEKANLEIRVTGIDISPPAPPQKQEVDIRTENAAPLPETSRMLKFNPLFKPLPDSVPVNPPGASREIRPCPAAVRPAPPIRTEPAIEVEYASVADALEYGEVVTVHSHAVRVGTRPRRRKVRLVRHRR